MEAILLHHERLDGSGYASALNGSNVSEYAKIMAIADAYDAMTSDRPYKKKVMPSEAFHMFFTTEKEKYDISIVEIFSHNILLGEEGDY